MRVYLVGLPGAGKSLLAKEVAESTNIPFIDLDAEIKKREGLHIATIFNDKGESYFRTVEAEVLRDKGSSKEFVMATGGGAPCFHNNMDFINNTGISVFLNTPIETIAKRLTAGEKKIRPLLNAVSDNQLVQKLNDLLHSRLEYYRQAHFSISGSDINAAEVIQLIKKK